MVQRHRTRGRRHDRQVCPMHSPASHQKRTEREKGRVLLFAPAQRNGDRLDFGLRLDKPLAQ